MELKASYRCAPVKLPLMLSVITSPVQNYLEVQTEAGFLENLLKCEYFIVWRMIPI